MAKYTVELNDIAKSGFKLFDFPYSFYDESKKKEFEEKFINHFRFNEIGTETVGRFQHYLKVKFDEVLPYYNMLLRTSLIDYEKLLNYYLTETVNKDNSKINNLLGNTIVGGSNSDLKTSTLDSDTTLHDNSTISKNEDVTETENNKGTVEELGENKNNIKVTNLNTKVESDTPTGLLALENIKNNVYASKANIEDNSVLTDDTQNTKANKKNETTANATKLGKVKEDAEHNSLNSTNANSRDSSNSSFTSDANTNQKTTATENEVYTKEIKGNVGVRSDAEMLQKHIELQKTLTTIYTKFFNECDDLFMQIY